MMSFTHVSIAIVGAHLRSLVVIGVLSLGLLVQRVCADEPHNDNHVRTSDSRIRAAVADGIGRSAFFRDLVARLDASDVIVYAETDCLMPSPLAGGLTFMSSVGGRRYVRVRIACSLDGRVQIAMLGHELRHAVEIADAGSVVDVPSLALAYQRIGFASGLMRTGTGYDSQAAIEAGRRVWEELSRRGE